MEDNVLDDHFKSRPLIINQGKRFSFVDDSDIKTIQRNHQESLTTLTPNNKSGHETINNHTPQNFIPFNYKSEVKPRRNSLITTAGSMTPNFISDKSMSVKSFGQLPNTFELLQLLLKLIIESYLFCCIMIVLIFWALFNDYLRLLIFSKSSDYGFYIIINIITAFFILEMIASLIYNRKYFNIPKVEDFSATDMYRVWIRRCLFGSFDFWSDFGSSFALLAHMKWALGTTYYSSQFFTVKWEVLLAAIRAGLVVKLLRMTRTIRKLNLANNLELSAKNLETNNKPIKSKRHIFRQWLNKKKKTDESLDILDSKVGAAMSELTTARVISLVFLLLMIVPLLSVYGDDKTMRIASTLLYELGYSNQTNPTFYNETLNLYLNNVISNTDVIGIDINGLWYYYNKSKMKLLRNEQMTKFYFDYYDKYYCDVYYSQETMVWQSTIFSLFLTLFIFLLILVGTFSFTHDIDYLVIKPIQRMVKLVQDIQTNPLGVEYKMLGEDDGFVKGLETTLLLTTINKIGGLLKVVFGEAGAAIIAKNLRDSNLYPSERSRLNLLGPGTRIFSVFGFCDIRQFTDTTECLQEEVMLFVNRIAYILHSIVVQCSGAANKNIGDAFLLTWKIDESLSSEQVSEVADKSLLAFCRTLIELSRHREFICEFSPKATQLLKQRFPSYTVRLGCGLHFGWAIEGAIGTDRKIDASYLSPHVSFVEYLEASTKVYGVAMVLSEPFVKLLTPEAFDCCRQIDRVCRSEDEDPVKLYTYDADLTINWDDIAIKYRKLSRRHALSSKLQRKNSRASSQIYGYGAQAPSAENHYMLKPQYSKNESAIKTNHSISSLPENVIHSINRLDSVEAKAIALRTHRSINEKGIRNIFNDIESGVSKRKVTENLTPYPPKIVVEKYSPIIWTKDDELRELRHVYSNAFRTAWTKGFDNYISGNWIEASILFEETFKLSGNSDGPSKYLLSIIASHGSSPPYNWEGYRMEDNCVDLVNDSYNS